VFDFIGTALGVLADLLTPTALRPRREATPIRAGILLLVLGVMIAISVLVGIVLAR
jgi:hypothetical protein